MGDFSMTFMRLCMWFSLFILMMVCIWFWALSSSQTFSGRWNKWLMDLGQRCSTLGLWGKSGLQSHGIWPMGLPIGPKIWWQGSMAVLPAASLLPSFWSHREPHGLDSMALNDRLANWGGIGPNPMHSFNWQGPKVEHHWSRHNRVR